MKKHLDLFFGIGGFAYAIDQVWDNWVVSFDNGYLVLAKKQLGF